MTQTPAEHTGGAVEATVSLPLTWTVCGLAAAGPTAAAAGTAASAMPASGIAASPHIGGSAPR
jgi:hypothetical protein